MLWRLRPYAPLGDIKPRPNDPNMPTQHIATLLGATCCVRLATVVQHVGCCWLKFENSQIWANKTQHVATQWPNARNITHTTCCAQQCCDWHVAIVWPGLKDRWWSWRLWGGWELGHFPVTRILESLTKRVNDAISSQKNFQRNYLNCKPFAKDPRYLQCQHHKRK